MKEAGGKGKQTKKIKYLFLLKTFAGMLNYKNVSIVIKR